MSDSSSQISTLQPQAVVPDTGTLVVLLVDDQAIVGHAVKQMLQGEADIKLHFCQDPTKALAIANELRPTVILQDLVMPEIDGLMLLKFFRGNPSTRETPMIVLSSKEEPATKAQAFALAEAVGNRNLPAALRILDEELWSMQFDKQKSEIGLLYGLITKVRVLLMAQDLLRSGKLKPANAYGPFKAQIERLDPDDFPKDRRYSPLGINPFVMFKALPQARNYTAGELVRAMEVLLESNRRLVSSGTEERLVIQQALVEIMGEARRPASD